MFAMSDGYRDADKLLSIISEVNDVLSLSNQPQNILDMVLDALLKLLKVDCCWVQLYQSENHVLQITACRGFTKEMKREIDSMDFDHSLAHQVAALGYDISLSDLSRDKKYRLSSFSKAGFRSVVAVPLMTYRVEGVMGIASSEKRCPSGIGKLLAVIAGLVSSALIKAYLYQQKLAEEKKLSISAQLEAQSITNGSEIIEADCETEFAITGSEKANQQPGEIDDAIPGTPQVADTQIANIFNEHTHKMKSFRSAHTTSSF